jgi:hypothetical protein
MGFDLTISFAINIDEKTGMPYVHYLNNGFLDKKPYDPEEFRIPVKYLEYIEQRGHHFHCYSKNFSGDVVTVRPKDFLHFYPDWNTVKIENDLFDDDDEFWTETNHNEFKEFLEWMESKSPYISVFEIHWSY